MQNNYFGDDIRLCALINSAGKLRILTSQPHIVGEAADYAEIQHWFHALGYYRLDLNGSIAWYLRSENLLVADAHKGNVIKTTLGELIPIDLNIVQPTGELRKWAVSACQTTQASDGTQAGG